MSELNNQIDQSIYYLENLNIKQDKACEMENETYEIENEKLIVLNQLLNISRSYVEDNKLYNTDITDTAEDLTKNYIPIYNVLLNRDEENRLNFIKAYANYTAYLEWYNNIIKDRKQQGTLITCKKYKIK